MDDQLQRAVTGLMKLEEAFTSPEFMCRIEELINSNLHLFSSGENTHTPPGPVAYIFPASSTFIPSGRPFSLATLSVAS